MRRCERIDHAVRWVGTQIREPPSFHGINDLETFFIQYEDEVLENQLLLALELALMATPKRWWGAHKETITDWYQCKRLLRIRFGVEQEYNKHKKISRTRGTNRTLGEVQNVVENDTTRGMNSSLHTYFRGHTSELVYGSRIAQRN
jgi:hypothetical protein